jgi:hypothetical protein
VERFFDLFWKCITNQFLFSDNTILKLMDKYGLFRTPATKSMIKSGNNITYLCGAFWTVPELLFASKKLIPALQQLLTGG